MQGLQLNVDTNACNMAGRLVDGIMASLQTSEDNNKNEDEEVQEYDISMDTSSEFVTF